MTDKQNIYPQSALDQHELAQWFEFLGYKTDWDHSGPLHWLEVIDPKTKRLVLQIDLFASKEKFVEEWNSEETEGPPPFFIATDEKSPEWETLKKVIDDALLEEKIEEVYHLAKKATERLLGKSNLTEEQERENKRKVKGELRALHVLLKAEKEAGVDYDIGGVKPKKNGN